MRIDIAAFTLRGAALAARLADALCAQGEEAAAFAAPAVAGQAGLPSTGGVGEWTQARFAQVDALIYVGATGIAVRAVAPHLRSKLTDPAVVSIDEAGRFAVALVSGHVGGANRLAARVAAITGGQAVISTATDVNGKFAVDEWIARQGLALVHPHAVRAVAGRLLRGEAVGFASDFPVLGALPDGLTSCRQGEAGLYVGIRADLPFDQTVVGVPKIVLLGIGCRKGIGEMAIDAAVRTALERAGILPESLCGAASIDLKRGEQGLIDYCDHHDLPLRFFGAEELSRAEGHFTPSERVLRVTGVDNVCERAAVCAGGRLIAPKMALDGVTVALAVRAYAVSFEGA